MNGSDTTAEPLCDVRPASAPSRAHLLIAVAVLLAAAVAAYWNSLQGAMVFDDALAIQANASIRHLGNLGAVLSPPAGGPTAGQPLVNLTLAVNYAIGGADRLWSYHAVNLTIHLLAALTLMGVVRRTLLTAPLVEHLGRAALPLAAATSLLWMLHPVQTEAVTYITQRSESLVGLLYLLTLYCAIRGASSPRPMGWDVLAVLACAAGMATKTVSVTAPLAVLVYDRLFLAGGWRKALARRWPLYLGLAATWAIAAALAMTTPRPDDLPGTGQYAATQASVIVQYLTLAVWPVAQSSDYVWPWAQQAAQVAPQALIVAILLAVTLWGLWTGRAVAMAGVWFFLVLAPTSSIVPMADPIFEHRLYLPLAGLAALAVVGAYGLVVSLAQGKPTAGAVSLAGRLVGVLIVVAVAATLGWMTHQRNKVYASPIGFWEAAATAQRLNDEVSYRTEDRLGNALIEAGRVNEGLGHLLNAMRVKSDLWQTPYRYACVMMESNRHAEAIGSLRQVARLRGDWAEPHRLLGQCYDRLGSVTPAIESYQQALKRDPGNADLQADLQRAKGKLGTRPTSQASQASQP